jgi:hypothetical protein
MYLIEIGLGNVHWICLGQDREEWLVEVQYVCLLRYCLFYDAASSVQL